MHYQIKEMDRKNAEKILTWHYDEPYSIYNLNQDEESLTELLNGTYYALFKNNCLIGYYCYGSSARVPLGEESHAYQGDYVDIGLGLHPHWCSRGFGYEFLELGLDYFEKKFKTKNFRLTVYDFNERAIRLYHNANFIIRNFFKGKDSHYFLIMTLNR